jgi:putative heme-binding domain-containing protein
LWKAEALRLQILAMVGKPGLADAERRAGFEALSAMGGEASVKALLELADPKQPAFSRRLAITSLASLDLKKAAKLTATLLADSAGDMDSAEILSAFLRQKQGTEELAHALADHKIPEDTAKIGIRFLRASGRNVDALTTALAKASGLTGKARTLNAEEMKQMIADVSAHGNAARGEVLYRRKDLTCLKCHAIGGAGGVVGPDLTSIGGSAQVDYLIDSLLDPNKAIKENYNTVVVTTNKGKVYTGIKVKETNSELVLRDADSKEFAIPIADIDEKTNGNSLMPNGLTDNLTRGELVDLVRFLSELGRTTPYQLSKARLARRWEVLEETPETLRHMNEKGLVSLFKQEPWQVWSSAYSTVSGELPKSDVPKLSLSKGQDAIGVVRCQIEVTKPGRSKIMLNSAKGLSFYLNGKKFDGGANSEIDLRTKGIHELVFVMDLSKSADTLRCELAEVPGSPSQFNFVLGR